MNIKKAYNFKQIDDLTSSSGTIMHVKLESLVETGYQTVINLLPDDNQHAKFAEKEDLEDLGIDYVYIPVDWENPTLADFEAFEAAMKLNAEKKVHIHCAANYRATAFYSVYANKNLGWSEEKMNKLMEPIWSLDDYPVWKAFVTDRLS